MANAEQEQQLELLKRKAKQLGEQRSRIEAEIESLSARLQAPGQPGLTGNLIDEEGFPRADIDIPRVRADRHRIAVLTTDHKIASRDLEQAIVAVHELARKLSEEKIMSASQGPEGRVSGTQESQATPPAPATPTLTAGVAEGARLASLGSSASANGIPQPMDTTPGTVILPQAEAGRQPFAVIDEVTAGSPGDLDGLKLGDYLVAFGGVTVDTPGGCIAAVAAELQRSKGRQVPVRVLRAGELQTFRVTPRDWGGRGLLGCHMVAL